MVPSALLGRQTGRVPSLDPHDPPQRPLGPLRSLAAALESTLVPQAEPVAALERLLVRLAEELGARELVWLPHGGGEVCASRPLALRGIEWEFVRELAPGDVRRISETARRRSPRLGVRVDSELYAAGADGVLRCLGGAPLSDADARALVEVVEGVARRRLQDGEEQSLDARGERALGRRAASLSHDMRNQMTLALLELERLRDTDRDALEAQGFDGLKSVLEEARELCADTLRVGQRTAPQALGLRAILTREAQAASNVARRSTGVRVLVSCPAGLVIHGSASMLARLARNLFSNAIEASYDGGEVRVKARALPDERVQLVVQDNGRGMAQAQVEALFESGKSASGGTGFGTTSLFECLRELRGELEVDTELGAGSRFTIQLQGMAVGDAVVLVVDADVRRRECTASTLEGKRATGVASASEALDRLRQGSIQRVIVARGTLATDELRAHCKREGVLFEVTSARVAPAPQEAPVALPQAVPEAVR